MRGLSGISSRIGLRLAGHCLFAPAICVLPLPITALILGSRVVTSRNDHISCGIRGRSQGGQRDIITICSCTYHIDTMSSAQGGGDSKLFARVS